MYARPAVKVLAYIFTTPKTAPDHRTTQDRSIGADCGAIGADLRKPAQDRTRGEGDALSYFL